LFLPKVVTTPSIIIFDLKNIFFDIITMTDQKADKKQTLLTPDLTPKRSGQPRRIYTDEERKERQKEYYKKHYHANRAKCDLSTKKSKLRAKGVVEWPGLDLTPRPRAG